MTQSPKPQEPGPAPCGQADRRSHARSCVALGAKRRFSRYTRHLKTVFLAHARADHEFARQLAEFLEFGCNLTCYVEDGLIGEDRT